MVIASSLSPASLLGSASALGAFRATPKTPHLELSPSGRAPQGALHPSQGNTIKIHSKAKPYKPL